MDRIASGTRRRTVRIRGRSGEGRSLAPAEARRPAAAASEAAARAAERHRVRQSHRPAGGGVAVAESHRAAAGGPAVAVAESHRAATGGPAVAIASAIAMAIAVAAPLRHVRAACTGSVGRADRADRVVLGRQPCGDGGR
ncbi:hypothetical protein [Kitasatospora sp. NPDC088346]|uniref:hypothetical protein n=1 Tax=Kitasatospora sp. NPDC088346 TaxID=3364073 RepID=UPI003812071F